MTPAVGAHIRRSGFLIPQDFAYADLLLHEPDPAAAGVWVHHEKVGELAVEQLVSQLEQNVRGIPALATTTLIGGAWHEGASLPAQSGQPQSADTASV